MVFHYNKHIVARHLGVTFIRQYWQDSYLLSMSPTVRKLLELRTTEIWRLILALAVLVVDQNKNCNDQNIWACQLYIWIHLYVVIEFSKSDYEF